MLSDKVQFFFEIFCAQKMDVTAKMGKLLDFLHDLAYGYATKEGCRTKRKSRNLEYAMGVRLTGFTT
jgi:hypothetical protein